MGILLDFIVDGPTMPGGDAFLEYVVMTCRVHLMSGQGDVLPDRPKHARNACVRRASRKPNMCRSRLRFGGWLLSAGSCQGLLDPVNQHARERGLAGPRRRLCRELDRRRRDCLPRLLAPLSRAPSRVDDPSGYLTRLSNGSGRPKERSSRAARNDFRLYAAFFTLPCGSMTNFFGEPSLNVLYASGACSSVMISVFSMAPR